MSLILDALKRTEANRKLGSNIVVKIENNGFGGDAYRSVWPRVLILVLFLVAVGSIGLVYLTNRNLPLAVIKNDASSDPLAQTPPREPARDRQRSLATAPVVITGAKEKQVATDVSSFAAEPTPRHPVTIAKSQIPKTNQLPSTKNPFAKQPVAPIETANGHPVDKPAPVVDRSSTKSADTPLVGSAPEALKPVAKVPPPQINPLVPPPEKGTIKVPEPASLSQPMQASAGLAPLSLSAELPEPPVADLRASEAAAAPKPLPLGEVSSDVPVRELKALPTTPEPRPVPPAETPAGIPEPAPMPVESADRLEQGKQLVLIVPPRKSPVPSRKMSDQSFLQTLRRAVVFEENGQLAEAIATYDQAISARPNLIAGYMGRGWAHESNRAYEAAGADFSKAIELDPSVPEPYQARGWIYEQSDQPQRAIDNYSKAIVRAPEDYESYFSRGFLLYYERDMVAAVQDFQVVYHKASAELGDYALLWMYLARAQAGVVSTADNFFADKTNRTKWPGIIYSAYIGEVSADRVLDAMRHLDSQTRRQRECVGYFFLGLHRLLRGDKLTARAYFKKTLATGVTNYRQYGAAKIELKNLAVN